MNLLKKKKIASKALGVGIKRIKFSVGRLDEIKDAISRQEIKSLYEDGAIIVKDISGRRKNTKKKNGRSYGKVRKKVSKRKTDYVIITRKLRKYAGEMKAGGNISREFLKDIRKKIRNREFKSKKQLKDYSEGASR